MTRICRCAAAVVIGIVAFVPVRAPQAASPTPTIEQFLAPGTPIEIVSAKKADRIAWTAYEHGLRNVYTASAPAFTPVRLTHVTKDDGVELSDIRISDDGGVVVFVRGTQPNREGWVANPTADPAGAQRTLWAAHTSGGPAWKLGEGTTPALSPEGRSVLFAKDGQIGRNEVRLEPGATGTNDAPHTAAARSSGVSGSGRTPFLKAWGSNGTPVWSPDGTKFAFVSDRVDHSLIGVYTIASRSVSFLSPSVDHDTSPTWSPDGTHVAFIRRPGTPFGLQAHQGAGSIGNPDGPAYSPVPALRGAGRGGRGTGQSGRGRGDGDAQRSGDTRPGLFSAAFTGGYTLSFWVADVASGEGREFWHTVKDDTDFTAVSSIRWADRDHVIFEAEPQEWTRWYSVPVSASSSDVRPIELTPGEGAVEHTAVSADGRTLFYSTNADDIERRHIWKVATAGGGAEQLTKGETIETYPVALATGKQVAVLGGDAKRPFGVGLLPATGGAAKYIYPSLDGFPVDAEVVPQLVMTKAADGMEIHNQLFVPKDLKPGEKRPAIVFVHGGPVRQMLLGYHY